MNAKEAIKIAIDMGSFVGLAYVNDLSDADLMKRPSPGCNHINWQLGHLIAAEHRHQSTINPQGVKALPTGFVEKYTPETASCDDPQKFCTKAELLSIFQDQRANTLASLEKLSEADLDRATGIDYAPTVGALYSLEGSHWLMHVGQWAVVRRQLGHKPLF
jgi:hypothetical protein